jgi:hypothetical protein
MSRKRKIIIAGLCSLCGVVVLLVGVYFYLMRWDGKYALYGTHYRIQESRFLETGLAIYVQEHGGNYPPMKSGDFWEVIKAMAESGERGPNNPPNPEYASTARSFMDYDVGLDAYAVVEKFGRIPADKFAFTYLDGLTAEDYKAILLYYNRSTVAKDQHAYQTQPNGPPIQGRLVVYAGMNEVEFIPEEKFQTELAATKKLIAERKAKTATSTPSTP